MYDYYGGTRSLQEFVMDRNTQKRDRDESGLPGGGRRDDVGRSGVYPASAPYPKDNAEFRGQASWGQGERGAANYEDHGGSELSLQSGQVLSAYTREARTEQALSIDLPAGEDTLKGDLHIPEGLRGLVLFAHGSGSSRHSPAISLWPVFCSRRGWQPCCSIF